MRTQLTEKQISKLREVEKKFAHLNKDEAEYALDNLLSCVHLISGVHIIDYALRYHDKNSILGYEYIFDEDFNELVKNTWSDLEDKSAIDSLWSLHKENSIVLLLDGEGRGVQIQLVDSAPTQFLTSLDSITNCVVRPSLQERRGMSEANRSLSKCGDIRR